MTLSFIGAGCANLQLAKDGQSSYEIVQPDKPTDVDIYSINILAQALKQKTDGIEFPVVSPGNISADKKHIFIGLSSPALKIVGGDPLSELKDQEYVARTAGADIVLYGKGMHGNLYAVCDFMETTLGRRWYTEAVFPENPATWERQESQPVFTVERNLSIEQFYRKGGFSFEYRVPVYPRTFFYQHGLNMGFSERKKELSITTGKATISDGIESLIFMPANCHTLFAYIPPTTEEQAFKRMFDWVVKKDYFKTNPEWFTMNKDGKRIIDQLCFSNSELRKELTKNIMEHIRILKTQGEKNLMIHLSAMDNVGEFCFCPGCQALKKKYGSLGGPIYDYLFELCPAVKEKHPDVMLQTLAYRLSQTQKPPLMPAGQTFPDNLVVVFSDVEDNTDADWNSPTNHPSYEDLLAWCKLTRHIWIWYYPNTYVSRINGNIERLVTDLRLMKKAGVEGVGYEFTSMDTWSGDNFTELQKYIYVKLLKDIDSDVPALVREFTDYQYGQAAPLVRTYLQELEDAQKAASKDTSPAAGRGIERRMTGLTPEILRRWHGYFDQVEKDAVAVPRCLTNARRLRHTLDFATLDQWNELTKAYPDYFKDYLVIKRRLLPLPPWQAAKFEDLELAIKMTGVEKPLPAQFDGIDKTLIKRLIPTRKRGAPKMVMDTDAAFGYGAVVNLPDKPFTFGFYQNDTKTFGLGRSLDSGDIQPGAYNLYKLGEIKVTPDCIIWFSSKSWETNLQLGDRLYSPPSPDNDNRYDVYVSLKFDKPIPPTPSEIEKNDKFSLDMNAPYSVLCDQIIFVKKPVR